MESIDLGERSVESGDRVSSAAVDSVDSLFACFLRPVVAALLGTYRYSLRGEGDES